MSITKASLIDLNGQELILDADADTSITADTDDRIDIKVAGSDIVHITSSGLAVGETDTSNYLSPDLVVVAQAQNGGITVKSSNTSHAGTLAFADATSGTDTYDGYVQYEHNNRALTFAAAGIESMRITGGSEIIVNDASADLDFRVESNDNANMLVVDGGNNQVGVGTSPSFTFHVSGSDVNAGVFDSDSDSGTYIWVRNSDATTGRTVNIGFAPANSIEGARISAEAMEDFSSSANRTADLAFQTRKDGTMSEKMRIDSAGQVNFLGTGDDGYTIPFDQDTTYANNLNAGAFSILHRNAYDSYIVGNAYYYKTGGTAGWRVKYGGYNSNVISMVNGRINFQATAGTVANNGDALNGLATRASIDSDGLKFGTDTAAANALDDYEESTFNTELVGDSSGTHTTSGSGRLTKIGRLASVLLAVDNVSSSSVSGNLRISLPVAYAGHDMYLPVQVYQLDYPADTKTAYAYVSNGYNYVVLYWSRDNNTSLNITNSHLKSGGGSYIRANFNYPTS